MKTIKGLLAKYREQIMYIIFGVLTTVVNYATYIICTRLAGMNATVSTAIAWLLSVIFAYVTNRKYVFESTASGRPAVLKEMGGFIAGRLLTGALDVAVMAVTVDMLHLNDLVMKILSNVIVVVLNYVISKLLVFRKS